jgi:hypothetical protein
MLAARATTLCRECAQQRDSRWQKVAGRRGLASSSHLFWVKDRPVRLKLTRHNVGKPAGAGDDGFGGGEGVELHGALPLPLSSVQAGSCSQERGQKQR